ncbi:pilus assembly protein PilM [Chloroflexota bacterium]
MAVSVVTLDIGNDGIKLLEVRGNRVRQWASAELEPGKVEGEVFSNQQTLTKLVKQLMASSNIRLKKVRASVNGVYSVSRILPMPTVPAGLTTQEFVMEIAREIMPVSTDSLYISWKIFSAGEDEQKVLILSVPQEILDGEVMSLKALGISPHILELRSMALTRVVNKKQALVLNVESSSYDIVIVVDGVPEVMHTIAWQQDELTVEEKAERLAGALEVAVSFHNSRRPDAVVDPDTTSLFITGQMSGDLELVGKLQSSLGYTVEALVPPLEYPADLPVSQYAVNIGLALRGMVLATGPEGDGPLALDVNLLPGIYSPWRPAAKQLYSFAVIIAAIAMFFPLFQATSEAMGETTNLQLKSEALNAELAKKQLEIKNREPIQKAINEYKSIVSSGVSFTDDVNVIINEAKKLGVQVASITHDGKSISVACQAEDYVTFRAFLTTLEGSGRFATPIPPPEGYPYRTGGPIEVEPAAGE